MSIGMSAAWNGMQPKKKRCDRCGLYYTETLAKCSHCGDLDEIGLKDLLQRHDEALEANRGLGKIFIFVAIIISVLLLFSFL